MGWSMKTIGEIGSIDKTISIPWISLIQTGNKVISQPNFAASKWEEEEGISNTDYIFDNRYFRRDMYYKFMVLAGGGFLMMLSK